MTISVALYAMVALLGEQLLDLPVEASSVSVEICDDALFVQQQHGWNTGDVEATRRRGQVTYLLHSSGVICL